MTAATVRAPGVRRAARRARAATSSVGVAGQIAAGILILLALIAVLAPLIAPHDPNFVDLSSAFQPPSSAHLLGTDSQGRDLLSRLIWGARSSLLGPLVIVAVATTAATVLALVAAWLGGVTDSLIARVLDIVFAFPGLLLAVLVVATFGTGLWPAVFSLCVAFTPGLGRVVRSVALRERELPYVTALRLQGLSGVWISVRHILPNVATVIVAQATLLFGYAMVDLAALSYLGLGVQPPQSDWGLMVSTGQTGILRGEPQESLYACVVIVIAVASFCLLGERLSERTERGAR